MDRAPADTDQGTPTVEISHPIAAGADTVWNILTDPARFSAWMQGHVTFDPRPGSPFRADFANHGIVMSGEDPGRRPRRPTLRADLGRRIGTAGGRASGRVVAALAPGPPGRRRVPAGTPPRRDAVGARRPGTGERLVLPAQPPRPDGQPRRSRRRTRAHPARVDRGLERAGRRRAPGRTAPRLRRRESPSATTGPGSAASTS